MNAKSLGYWLSGVLACCSIVGGVQASSVEDKVKKALAMDYRTEKELARDADRKAVEAIAFMGLKDDMKVIEFFPAGQAWYTKILGPVLAEKGELILIDSERTFSAWDGLLENPAFGKVSKVLVEASYNRPERRYNLGEFSVPATDADMFLNIREYHNFNDADKQRLNGIAFNSLKSGGKYIVIDHSRRHMQPEEGMLFRREDPVQVILEVQAAGFVLEKSSDMFFNANDPLDVEVSDKAVSNQTDRFFLVFKKP